MSLKTVPGNELRDRVVGTNANHALKVVVGFVVFGNGVARVEDNFECIDSVR